MKVWHLEERFGRFYVVDEYGGFAMHWATREAARTQALGYVISDGDSFVDSFEGEGAADYVCAECGTTEASTYVVTTLDASDPHGTRTEVCLACHEALTTEES